MRISIDPKGAMCGQRTTHLEIFERYGGTFVPWALNTQRLMSIRDACLAQYGYEATPMGGRVNEFNYYTFEGDPDLPPALMIEHGKETVLVYPYSIIAFLHDDEPTYITRLD